MHGSLALDAYVPDTSDVDLLVIVESALTEDEVDHLTRVVLDSPPPLDFRVVTRATAAQPTREPFLELGVGTHGDVEIAERVVERDLLVELSMARAVGRSLLGPPPRELIGEVPDGWVVEYGDEILARWETLTDDTEHKELMTRTACRIWRFAEEGVYSSKSAAAEWAVARDPSLDLDDVAAVLRRVRRTLQAAR